MDDTIVSHTSEEECVHIVETLPKVTEGMGMKIQKFYSNSKLALKSLTENLLSTILSDNFSTFISKYLEN